MKNLKAFKAWSAVFIIGILISAILLTPTNPVMATLMLPDVATIQQNSRLDNKTKERLISHIIQNDTRKLEQDFRKAYNIPVNAEVYVEVSTNPPPAVHRLGEVIPSGTVVYALDNPTVGPMVLLPVGAIIIVVAIAITVLGVVIYVVYRVIKKLDQILRQKTNDVTEGLTAMSYRNDPTFTFNGPLPTVINNARTPQPSITTNVFNFDTMTGTLTFNVQSSTDLRTWNTELKVTNTVTAGVSSVVVYDGMGVPILTNSSNGMYDGTNLLVAPADVTGIVIKDSTRDAQKYWRFQQP